jgi:hypothetical protein
VKSTAQQITEPAPAREAPAVIELPPPRPRRGGRRRKAVNPRIARIELRTTPDRKAAIRTAAQMAGMSVTDYLLTHLPGWTETPRLIAIADPEILARMLAELGSARGKPLDLAKHVEKEENEAVWIAGCKDLAAKDIEGALIEMDALGAALRTRRTLYHMSINPQPGKDREMTAEEWDYACNVALQKQGLENQPYIVIGHKKFGKDGVLREHRHVIASLTDLEHMRAMRTDHNYRKHEEAAREIERYLGHEMVQGAHVDRNGVKRPDRTPTHAQHQQAERGAVSAREAKALGAELWKATDSGKALNAGLEAQGWMLARGDKARADGGVYFMAIDPQGGTHELRRMVPVKAAELYARMADVAPANLPTVKAAKTFQLERAAAREAQEREKLGGRSDAPRPSHMRTDGPQNGREGHSDPRTDGTGKNSSKQQNTAGHMREAWTAANDAGDLVAALAARNIRLARVMPDEARFNQQQRAVAKQLGRVVRPMRDGEIMAVDARGHMYRFDKRTTGAERGEIKQRLAGVDAGFLLSVEATKEAQRAASRAAWKEQQRIEREKARPLTKIEQTIVDAAKAAAGDREKFTAELHKEGVALVRVTAADVQALDALRRDDELARVTAAANDAVYRPAPFLADVREGELAAVLLRSGAVLRLNPHHLTELAAVGIMAERQPAKGPDMEPDTTTENHNAPMTAKQAADGLALRGLQSETRDEMEMRHLEERTFGYTTEEFPRQMAERHTAELAALEIREAVPPDAEKRRQGPVASMTEITQLHNPEWRPVDAEWHMLVGNRSVARLVPIPVESRGPLPWANWLSLIDADGADYEDHGWHAVDFATLADGQRDLEQWWFHMCRGEKYRPDTGETRDVGNSPAAGETHLPGVSEARAAGEIARGEAGKFQQGMIDIQLERRDEATAARVMLAESGQAIAQQEAVADMIQQAAQGTVTAAHGAVDRAERVASGFGASAAAWFEGIISRLGDMWRSPWKPTELEREIAPKVADERAQENADLAAYFNNEAARDRILDQIRIDDAEQERQERLDGGRERER